MKINDVEKITCLSRKAIRLYEIKGLLCVSRDENGYRNYSNEDVDRLKEIKLLRTIGTPISDIKLYLFGVMSLDELMDKRKSEILKESGKNSEKYRICESISNSNDTYNFNEAEDCYEAEDARDKSYGKISVGIDIGTTTVSAVVYDIDNKEQIEAYTLPHNSYIHSDVFSEQSVSVILEKSEKLLYHILNSYENIISIGISGQMHGIAYIDKNGSVISNLINWQDKRADLPLSDKKSVCEKIFSITGETIHTGYGIATHYYNMLNGQLPENASCILSIMDIFAMKICSLKTTTVHSSVAASLGLFDLEKCQPMTDKLTLLGIDSSILPPVTSESIIIGKCREIPVSIPIGDNQASFLGSVGNKDTLLINIGTGSQASSVSDYCQVENGIELRPFIEGKYLICASALCGGYAYSMLEEFFRSYTVSLGIDECFQYKTINQLAKEAYEKGEKGLLVDTSFLGKRGDPNVRGSIKMIDRQNFTPANLALGVLKGMCNELYELYSLFPVKHKSAVASGGAVKKNSLLKILLSDCFGMTVSDETVKEEAATGVSLFSALAVKKIKYNDSFSEYINQNRGDL